MMVRHFHSVTKAFVNLFTSPHWTDEILPLFLYFSFSLLLLFVMFILSYRRGRKIMLDEHQLVGLNQGDVPI